MSSLHRPVTPAAGHLQGEPLRQLALTEAQHSCRADLQAIMAKGYDDVGVVHGIFGSACYIDDSFPSMLYLAYKYAGADLSMG